jgi:hypothetical protein
MSIAAGSARMGRSQRAGTTRPGAIGRGIRAGARALGGLRGRGARGFRRHRRGISATELRGFRKVVRLLRMVGMRPRGTGQLRARRTT